MRCSPRFSLSFLERSNLSCGINCKSDGRELPMTKPSRINTLFLDIGGVLLTNGWDRNARARAAEKFHLDQDEFSERHHMTFDTYEEGKLSLDEYSESRGLLSATAVHRAGFQKVYVRPVPAH